MKKLLPVLLILLLATVAFAQQNKGKIVGTVTTVDGAVIEGVKVTISSDKLISRTMETITNERGMFRFVLLPVGDFDIVMEKEGYQSVDQKGLVLDFDSTITLNKVLQTADFGEVITITGEAPIVDKTSTTIGNKLDTAILMNTSNNTRNIWNLPNLTAGFTNNSSFGAVERSSQAYNIDGVNVSDGSTGTSFASVSLDSVEQMDITQLGANVEYGAYTGASLNVITKVGGNEFSGSISYYAQRVDWVGDNTEKYPLVGVPVASDVNEMNFTVGGPVIQDQIWFFGSYHRQDLDTARESLSGPFTVETKVRRPFVKLSARWDDRNLTTASYNGYTQDLSHRLVTGGWLQNYEYTMWQQKSAADTFLIEHSFVINDDLILEARYAGYSGNFHLQPREKGTFKYDSAQGRFLEDSKMSYDTFNDRNRHNIITALSYFNDDLNGTHSFKFGAEYENSPNGRSYEYDREYYYNGVKYFAYIGNEFTSRSYVERFAGYAQDSWTVNDRLTINYGARVDRSQLFASNPDEAYVGKNAVFSFTDITPRIGFAYDLLGDEKTVLHAHFGRYYEAVLLGNTESLITYMAPFYIYYGPAILGGPDQWTLVATYDNDPSTYSVQDDMSNQYSNAFTIGIDHELIQNLAVSLSYIYREDQNVVGYISADGTWNEATANYSNANGSYTGVYYPGYLEGDYSMYTNIHKGMYGVLDEPKRWYSGASISINKRMSDNWSMIASYTYSMTKTNLSMGYGTIQGFTNYSNPNYWINAYGRGSLDRPHQIKLSGTYMAPFDVIITPTMFFVSGTPWTPSLSLGGSAFAIEPVDGSRRLDSQFNVDLRIEKAFMIMEKYRLGLAVDIFNILNADYYTAIYSAAITSSNFGKPSAVPNARSFQALIRLNF